MNSLNKIVLGFVLLGIFCTTANAQVADISVSAHSAALYIPELNEFLYLKNADEAMPMASTTKIMTALIVLENTEPDDIICIPDEAVGVEGSSAYLKGGEELTVSELLYALLLQSANDVAVSLALHVGGSIDGFAEMMNRRAESLGLKNTHFKNPHGLDDKEHYTTARELAIITAEAMKRDDFCNIVSTERKSFITEDRSRTYINHNKLLRMYDGCIGVKTGFTKKSGRCLVSAAERDGLSFISVTLNAPSDWADHDKMLDLGFSRLEKIQLCDSEDFSYTLPVIDGEKESVKVGNRDAASIILARENRYVEEFVKLNRYVVAPINEGDILGEVIFTLDGEECERVRLVALESVREKKEKGFFDRILSHFK